MMVHDVPECTLPVIPAGMYPDETYGDQCTDCPYGIETPHGVVCELDVQDAGL